MHIGSTEYLRLLVQAGGYIEFELAVPHGLLKGNVITLKTGEGRNLELRHPSGYRVSPVELARAIFDDFVRQGLIHQDGPVRDGVMIFRLTDAGIERGAPAPKGPQWLIERLRDSDREPSPLVKRLAQQYIASMAPTADKPPQA